jgi:glycosyltransferase involved in cell wall biosynthesis
VRDESRNRPHIVWVYTASLSKVLDAASWINTVENLRKFGWQVTLLAVGPAGYQTIRGIEVLCFPRREIYFLRRAEYHLRVLRFIVSQFSSIDAIIFHDQSAPWLLPLRLLRRLIGKKYPLFVMDSRSLPMPQLDKGTWKDKVREKYHHFSNRLGNTFADGRLTITHRMAVAAGIPKEKLWGIWPSGVDIEHFTKARMLWPYPATNASIQLIYHGSMHYERNLMTLCRAVKHANDNGMLFKLSLVGDGTEREELMTYAAQNNQIISVVPPIDYEQIPKLLAQAHIGVLPFPDEEKFRVSSPIKLFEYMAAGLPILATRIVCHTDVVGDGEFVIWAEDASEQGLFNALKKAWKSRDQLKEMGKRAARASHAWTWEAAALKLKEALEVRFISRSSK